MTFVEGRGNVDGVIVGTDVGTYITTSEAYGTWSIYGANLPNAPAMDVQYNAADDVLSVGLLGRGAWTVSVASTTFSEEANVAPVVNDQAFSINENSPNTTAVGTVVASDANAGQVLMYAITAGNASGAFSINSGTGAITVANSSLVNFESTPSFTLTVEVTDNGTPALSDTATITINLNDVNEVPVANASNITTNEDTAKTFTDAENNSLVSIAVSKLTLAVGDTQTVNQGAGAIAVANGMTILAAEIPTLTYPPAPVHDSTTTAIATSVNDAPTLGGAAANQPVNDDATIAPFASMTVTDPDTQDMYVRVTILNAAVRGDFTAASATGWTRTAIGNNTVYDRYFPQQSNLASSVQSAIRGLVFQPLTNALRSAWSEVRSTSWS